ncbi:MAG: chitobiase/beta-hexosaminidase C-terminal domain-containing protein [Muribaculaceae bacterium]|nr:chitobiase/beta-hexosaminidase C-terminal domain-containing protein [Muribaculaceae bacterium]
MEYKGELTIDATTTFKAVAFIGNLYSVVVEKTYTKTPAAPEISPASCTFSEPFQVTITAAESGATIYYTTDGSNPTDQSTQYTGPFTVSTTTTVKAKAYVDGVYGATATATYTYSNVQPSTGDFVLVTSADQLVAGNEYIILNASGTYALGELTNAGSPSNLKGIGTQDFTLDNTTVSAGSGVTIFTLEESGSKWKFKISDNSYLTAPSSTNLSSGSTGTQFDITISNNIAAIASASNRNIWFSSYEGTGNYAGTTFNVFGNYSTSNTSGYEKVYLYTREGNTVLTTTPLADLEANPEQGKSYVIRDMLTVAYVAADGTAYAKDNNGAAEQTAEDGQIDYLAEKVSTVNTDHSNWIAITGLTDDNLTEGSRLTNVVGTLRDAVNFTLAAQSATVDNTNIEEPVVINQYVPCNFGASTQIIGDKTYFFAHPQIMEYAYIFAAVWKGNDTFEVPENNAAGLTGSFTADLNGYGENLEQGTVYEFHAIVKKAAAGGNGAPRRIAGNGGDYEVMLTEGPKNPDVQTAVTDVRNAGEVAGVKYVNVAGQVAATPWQGVNIVVTRYTDGSTRTTKVVK